jgi:proteasome lid subunit RPN8/RPN11
VESDRPRSPVIFITGRAFHRLKLLLRLCPAEIAGLGYVTPRPDGFLILDVFALPQRVTDSDAELDPEALLDFLTEFVSAEGDPSSLQFWWHSHVDGELYWSPTDLETIERFSGNRVISIVGNQQGELLCRLDLFTPRRECFEGLPLVLADEDGGPATLDLEALRREVQAEIRTKVRMRIPVEPPTDHEGVVGLITNEEYDVEVVPSDKDPAPGPTP